MVWIYLDNLPEEIMDGYTSLLEPPSLQELVFAWAEPPEPQAPPQLSPWKVEGELNSPLHNPQERGKHPYVLSTSFARR